MAHPFEPMTADNLDYVTYKTAFLLAITSAKRVGELQALSIDGRYLHITPAGIRLTLNPAFVPKVNNDRNREQELFFTPFCPRTQADPNQTFYTLCVRRAVEKYMTITRSFRQPGDDHLFVCFHGARKGHAASKPTISRWVRSAIREAYKAIGQDPPNEIRAHDTRGVASTWAQFHNATLRDICDTASWEHSSTFVKHYQLNLAVGESSARFGNAVLQTVLDGRPQ
jgi:integrase